MVSQFKALSSRKFYYHEAQLLIKALLVKT